jgi:N-acetyl-1-D-myo-inositol-2-amino-2-deoxy-alpha-D-glucopyranoside deacetylase
MRPVTGGLMVVTSHPDDEVLIAGGTLAACAAAGMSTSVVCLTRGEHGPISDPALSTREELGHVRAAELATACAELGVGSVKCFRRQDGNLRWSNRSAIARQLARILERRRPDAVISFGDDGLYYHPDHIATHECVRRAVERVTEPPVLYRSVWPGNLMVELAAELERRGLPTDLWEMDPEDFGSDDEASFALDVRRFAECKRRAIRAHRTQISSEHAFAALDGDLVERFLGHEWFAEVNGRGDGGAWLKRAVAHA